MFVTEDEIAANLEVGRVRAIEERADRERRKAERAAQKDQAAETEKSKWEQLCALDPPPEVLLTTDGDLWVKADEGWTIEGQEEDIGYADDFGELLEHLAPADIDKWWATHAEHSAAQDQVEEATS